MKRAPLYSGPRRSRSEPTGEADAGASARSVGARADRGPARRGDMPVPRGAVPAPRGAVPAPTRGGHSDDRFEAGSAGLAGPAGSAGSAGSAGAPPFGPGGGPFARRPTEGARPGFAPQGDPGVDPRRGRAFGGQGPGPVPIRGRTADGGSEADDGREAGVGPRAPGRSAVAGARRFARPVVAAVIGALLVIGWTRLAPPGWPGSQARPATFSQEQIDDAVRHSLQTVPLPSMAARAAAIVAPSVVRVRSYGTADDAAESAGRPLSNEDRSGPPPRLPGAPVDRLPGPQGTPPDGLQGKLPGHPPGPSAPAVPSTPSVPSSPSVPSAPSTPSGPSGSSTPANPPSQATPTLPEGRPTAPPTPTPTPDAGRDRAGAPNPAPAPGSGGGSGPGARDGAGPHGAEVQSGVGTGVVIKDDGLILSNLHVVAGARRIAVVFADGSESPATIVGARPEHDLAILRASRVPDDLQPAVLRSTGDLGEGEGVVVVGFPFDIGPSVSAGVISGFNREYQSPSGARILSNLIQFDAAANPGNSGGPLATMDGEVIGIVTAILNPNSQRSFVGIGFAVPIENAMAAAGLPPH